jgi:hypothetical protein
MEKETTKIKFEERTLEQVLLELGFFYLKSGKFNCNDVYKVAGSQLMGTFTAQECWNWLYENNYLPLSERKISNE